MEEQNGKEPKRRESDVSLDELYKLVKQNNKMLKRMRRDAFVGGILKFVWWAAILIVIPYLIYVFYLQPYVLQLQSLYNTVNESAGQINDATNQIEEVRNSIPNFQDILDRFGGGN